MGSKDQILPRKMKTPIGEKTGEFVKTGARNDLLIPQHTLRRKRATCALVDTYFIWEYFIQSMFFQVL